MLKFIFGEISGTIAGEEYYEEEDENSYIVAGDMRLADFYNLTNFDINDPVMTTIGGVAFRLFDGLPAVGDKVTDGGYEYVAEEVTGLRISKVRVTRCSAVTEEPREAEAESEQPVSESNPAGNDETVDHDNNEKGEA